MTDNNLTPAFIDAIKNRPFEFTDLLSQVSAIIEYINKSARLNIKVYTDEDLDENDQGYSYVQLRDEHGLFAELSWAEETREVRPLTHTNYEVPGGEISTVKGEPFNASNPEVLAQVIQNILPAQHTRKLLDCAPKNE